MFDSVGGGRFRQKFNRGATIGQIAKEGHGTEVERRRRWQREGNGLEMRRRHFPPLWHSVSPITMLIETGQDRNSLREHFTTV